MIETETIVKTENQESNNGGSRCLQTLVRPVLINDHFQNFKRYNIPKAQLLIADIPVGCMARCQRESKLKHKILII